MKRIDEIRSKRSAAHIAKRLKGKKSVETALARRELERDIALVSVPAASEMAARKSAKLKALASEQMQE